MKIEELINITESFNAQFDSLRWRREDSAVIGIGNVNDQEFRLEIGLFSITLDKKMYSYVTLEFYKIVDNVATQELTGENTNQSVIFGCIKNAFYNKIANLDQQYNIDAIVTLIKTHTENKYLKRLSLYKNMFSKNQGNSRWNWIHDFMFNDLIGSIYTKQQIDSATLNSLKASIKLNGKLNLRSSE